MNELCDCGCHHIKIGVLRLEPKEETFWQWLKRQVTGERRSFVHALTILDDSELRTSWKTETKGCHLCGFAPHTERYHDWNLQQYLRMQRIIGGTASELDKAMYRATEKFKNQGMREPRNESARRARRGAGESQKRHHQVASSGAAVRQSAPHRAVADRVGDKFRGRKADSRSACSSGQPQVSSSAVAPRRNSWRVVSLVVVLVVLPAGVAAIGRTSG